MDQPGNVTNRSRGELNRENILFFLSPFAPEKLCFARDRFGRPVPRSACSFSVVKVDISQTSKTTTSRPQI